MPLFQDDAPVAERTPPIRIPPKARLASRTGPSRTIVTKPSWPQYGLLMRIGDTHVSSKYAGGALQPQAAFTERTTSDRGEFIELLKKGEKPTWLPSKNLGTLLLEEQCAAASQGEDQRASPLRLSSTSLHKTSQTSKAGNIEHAGSEIARPRSALHSGNFRDDSRPDRHTSQGVERAWGVEDQPPWLTFPLPDHGELKSSACISQCGGLFDHRQDPLIPQHTLSSSLSVFQSRPPTSPLVQSQSNDEVDVSVTRPTSPLDTLSNSFGKQERISYRLSWDVSNAGNPVSDWASSDHCRDSAPPRQAHQPRRSLTGTPNFDSNQPQTPPSRARRPSLTSEGSPLLHAPMVGSYEESILRGRMSTTPSKPLDFMAQIGVLGLGDCRPALKCPAHVTVPFPAVFYSYGNTSHGRSGSVEDGPSPYVGQIDLENSLPGRPSATPKRKRQPNQADYQKNSQSTRDGISTTNDELNHISMPVESRTRTAFLRAPPGGSYRIPQQGQLQIIINNPNRTAVKLFLVPYDLSDMEPGTKTFIRQRSYSAGPVLDSTLLSSTSRSSAQAAPDRATLRYLVHLHICCPSRGRYYLYKSIRVVFANRVPDGKEKLRIEVSLPEPRFSAYKALRDAVSSGAGAGLTAEKAFRRRSAGLALGSQYRIAHPAHDTIPPGQQDWTCSSLAHGMIRSRASSLSSTAASYSGSGRSVSGPDMLETHWSGPTTPPSTTIDEMDKSSLGYEGNTDNSTHLQNRQRTQDSILASRLKGLGLPGTEVDKDGLDLSGTTGS